MSIYFFNFNPIKNIKDKSNVNVNLVFLLNKQGQFNFLIWFILLIYTLNYETTNKRIKTE